MLDVIVTEPARLDIKGLLASSLQKFGEDAMRRYRSLIDTVIRELAEDPCRVGVRQGDRPALEGLSRYHIAGSKRNAAIKGRIVQKPRHIVFFRVVDDRQTLEIIRILHAQMDFESQLVQ